MDRRWLAYVLLLSGFDEIAERHWSRQFPVPPPPPHLPGHYWPDRAAVSVKYDADRNAYLNLHPTVSESGDHWKHAFSAPAYFKLANLLADPERGMVAQFQRIPGCGQDAWIADYSRGVPLHWNNICSGFRSVFGYEGSPIEVPDGRTELGPNGTLPVREPAEPLDWDTRLRSVQDAIDAFKRERR